jgi:hypothetical protein
VHTVGRYSIWRPKNVAGWIDPLHPATQVRNVDFQVGAIRFELASSHPAPRVVVKTSWHPWWTVEGAPGATLSEVPDGMLAVDVPAPGRYHIQLRYVPSPWPGRLSTIGWLLLFAWAATLLARRKRRSIVF